MTDRERADLDDDWAFGCAVAAVAAFFFALTTYPVPWMLIGIGFAVACVGFVVDCALADRRANRKDV